MQEVPFYAVHDNITSSIVYYLTKVYAIVSTLETVCTCAYTHPDPGGNVYFASFMCY